MQIPRWQNVLAIRNSLFSLNSTATHFSLFHSTPTSCAKSKDKWSNDKNPRQEPSKDHVRYVVRQNRAAAKRALKGLVFNNGSSNASFMDVERMYRLNDTKNGHIKRTGYEKRDNTIDPSKSSARLGKSCKSHNKKIKRNFRRGSFSDSDDDPEPFFQATLGDRCYTWSFNSWHESPFQNSTSGFEWREHSNWKSSRTKRWESTNETGSDDGSCYVGSHSDRIILGLPPTGPLKIEDVKNAFRLSALKWHPDKHQGPSQAVAEEKFKLCSTAYKSLCSALSPLNL